MNHTNIRKMASPLAAFILTAAMLTLAQAPIGWWPLAWAAYVPFILVCSSKSKPSRLYLASYIVGTCFWLGNIYWISFVTVAGWIAACMYLGLLWPLLALTLRWCINRKIPLVIAVPILVVGMEKSQGLFFGGFFWHFLGHSQYDNTALIQIADIFGAAGVSFLVAMANGVIAQLVISAMNLEKKQDWRFSILNSKFSILIVVAAVAGALIYGKWRIGQSDRFITSGPMIGAVQTNVPQSVKESFEAEQQIFDEALNEGELCLQSGAELIVWPETMVQAILEPQVLRLLDESHSYKIFDKTISVHAQKGAYVLVGAYGGNHTIEENRDIKMTEKFNSAFLYKPDGSRSPQKYYKIHLVPFGEYLPFKNIPLIHNLLLKFSPYDFDYTLDAGKTYTAFEMAGKNGAAYRFSVIICYEDAVPNMVRRFVLDKDGRKRIDWLVNISNDGWFVRFKDDKVLPSSELAQHTAICVFRAIENRVVVLRCVNTGISCMIDSLGQIRNGYAAGNLPENAFDRQGVKGWFADMVPIDSRITFFSRYGFWLDFACQLCLAGIIITRLAERFIFQKMLKPKP
ncbi:MAG: apolipoprotein N-acyltransferase [Sedimentisphaerales bacterium]|nr:apolipoprotein N-acyltransferase [Sedimentisphaerales bacterium]